jgi:dTDP-4-dehydrorhamnose reductase
MKIVLLGRKGQVGWELQRSLAPLGELVALDRGRGADGRGGDLGEPEQLAATVRSLRPDVIVNAAAYTAVDRAESEPGQAALVNGVAPGVLAREAAALGAWLVHFSTDHVFDGSGRQPRGEDAPTGALNAYGRSKLDGEERIRASGCRHLILRTSWVYAARGNNFVRTMLRMAAELERLAVADDQVGAPTGAELVADVTAHVLRRAHDRPDLSGTYHLAASGEVSRHGYASFVVECARARGHPLKATPADVEPVPSSTFATAARRPLNSRLATVRLRRAFDIALPPWQTGIERVIAELLGA